MRSVLAVIVASIVVVACGGGVDEGFTGTWRGTTTLTGPASSITIQGQLSLTADGDVLRVSAFCPDGTGSIQVPGEGDKLSWSGDVACPIPTQDCPAAVLRYATAEFLLSDDARSLTVSATGSISGCGAPFSVRTTFSGSR